MEGLGSGAWKIARLPGSLSLSQARPMLAVHHPVWVMRGRGAVLDLLQKGRLGSKQRRPGLACLHHLCRADLGPHSLGLQGSLVGRVGAGRPPCPPWSALPSAVCWKRLSLHTVGPSVKPSLWGGLGGMLGRLVAWLGLPSGWSSVPWIPGLPPVALP